MTIKEFEKFIIENNINSRHFSLNGEFIDDSYVICEKDFLFIVYYYERFEKFTVKECDTYEEALSEVYKRLKFNIECGLNLKL